MTGIHLHQFFGIELADFACETAKLSLWIAEYQMNERLKEVFGSAPPALPLKDSGHIIHGNAPQLDWRKICPQIRIVRLMSSGIHRLKAHEDNLGVRKMILP